MAFKFSPGCPCCTSCRYTFDHYERTNLYTNSVYLPTTGWYTQNSDILSHGGRVLKSSGSTPLYFKSEVQQPIGSFTYPSSSAKVFLQGSFDVNLQNNSSVTLRIGDSAVSYFDYTITRTGTSGFSINNTDWLIDVSSIDNSLGSGFLNIAWGLPFFIETTGYYTNSNSPGSRLATSADFNTIENLSMTGVCGTNLCLNYFTSGVCDSNSQYEQKYLFPNHFVQMIASLPGPVYAEHAGTDTSNIDGVSAILPITVTDNSFKRYSLSAGTGVEIDNLDVSYVAPSRTYVQSIAFTDAITNIESGSFIINNPVTTGAFNSTDDNGWIWNFHPHGATGIVNFPVTEMSLQTAFDYLYSTGVVDIQVYDANTFYAVFNGYVTSTGLHTVSGFPCTNVLENIVQKKIMNGRTFPTFTIQDNGVYSNGVVSCINACTDQACIDACKATYQKSVTTDRISPTNPTLNCLGGTPCDVLVEDHECFPCPTFPSTISVQFIYSKSGSPHIVCGDTAINASITAENAALQTGKDIETGINDDRTACLDAATAAYDACIALDPNDPQCQIDLDAATADCECDWATALSVANIKQYYQDWYDNVHALLYADSPLEADPVYNCGTNLCSEGIATQTITLTKTEEGCYSATYTGTIEATTSNYVLDDSYPYIQDCSGAGQTIELEVVGTVSYEHCVLRLVDGIEVLDPNVSTCSMTAVIIDPYGGSFGVGSSILSSRCTFTTPASECSDHDAGIDDTTLELSPDGIIGNAQECPCKYGWSITNEFVDVTCDTPPTIVYGSTYGGTITVCPGATCTEPTAGYDTESGNGCIPP